MKFRDAVVNANSTAPICEVLATTTAMKAAEFFKKGADVFKKYRLTLAIAPLMLVFATVGNMYSVR